MGSQKNSNKITKVEKKDFFSTEPKSTTSLEKEASLSKADELKSKLHKFSTPKNTDQKDLKHTSFAKKSSKTSILKKNILKKPQIKNKELEKKVKELEELSKSYRYLQAEFANFKKIAQKEKEQAVKYSSFNFLRDVILNFLNDFNRAMESSWASKDFESFKKGVKMLHSKFIKVLQQYDVVEISPKGQLFNPNVHEVVSVEENKEHPEDTILCVCRNGYQLYGRLVQPAQVIVSKNPQTKNSQKSS